MSVTLGTPPRRTPTTNLIEKTMWRAIIVLVLLPSIGEATSFAKPKRHDVLSPNRQFVLDVNPLTHKHTVYSVTDRNTPLWSFIKPVSLEPLLLSNDGLVVVWLHWKFVGENTLANSNCIEFWNKDGLFRAHPFAELCSDPARTWMSGGGPLGLGWRTWYTKLDQDADAIVVRTTDLHEYTLLLPAGEVTDTRLVIGNIIYKPVLYVAFVSGAILLVLVVWYERHWRRNQVKTRASVEPRGTTQAA
jgi:hypothetical protein